MISYKSYNLKIALILISSLFLFNSMAGFQNSSAIDSTISRNTFSTAFGYLKLNVNSNNSNYSTEIYFNSNATQGLDPGYDASIIGGNIPAFSIYSYLVQNNTGIPFAIQSLSETDMNNIVIPIGISANKGQEITVSISESDLPDSINVYFENASSKSSILLNSNTYNFTFNTNLLGIGNFYLRFEADALTQPKYTLDDIQIYTKSTEKTIIIKGELQKETNFKLYDIKGRTVGYKALDITSTNQSITTYNLNTGVYIIELTNNANQKRIQKIIIQ